MRLWSIHPKYLDAQGLVALWREGLLAQKVLCGRTKGYRSHPQLVRFREARNPVASIAEYLRGIVAEADERGYSFDRRKIAGKYGKARLPVTTGQVSFEFRHLLTKLRQRSPAIYRQLRNIRRIEAHPLFRKRRGRVAAWERIRPRKTARRPS